MRDVNLEILPFTKRWPYSDEREYRAVYVSAEEELPAFPVPIALAAIKRITLSPWLAPAFVDPVKKTLKSLPGCGGLRIYRSTLIDNKQWQKFVGRVVPLPIAPKDHTIRLANAPRSRIRFSGSGRCRQCGQSDQIGAILLLLSWAKKRTLEIIAAHTEHSLGKISVPKS